MSGLLRSAYEPMAVHAGRIDQVHPATLTALRQALRAVIAHCIYGVDVNPMAVEMAKLSIWLVTLAKGRPFGFLFQFPREIRSRPSVE